MEHAGVSFVRSVSSVHVRRPGYLSWLEGPKTQITEVVLVNLNDETHTVELHIERSGEEVLRTTETVPADGPQPVLTSDDSVSTEQDEYTVVASLNGSTDEISRTFPN